MFGFCNGRSELLIEGGGEVEYDVSFVLGTDKGWFAPVPGPETQEG